MLWAHASGEDLVHDIESDVDAVVVDRLIIGVLHPQLREQSMLATVTWAGSKAGIEAQPASASASASAGDSRAAEILI